MLPGYPPADAIQQRRGLQSDPLLRGLVASEHEGEGKDGGPEGGGWAAAERPPGGAGAGDGSPKSKQ